MHIGLIGGIGPAATAFYYQRIVRLFAEAKTPLSLTIVHTDIGRLAANVKANNVKAQAEEYRRITEQLAAAGADKVAITSFGGSFCADEFEKVSPLPMMDGPTAMAEHLREAGLQRVGLCLGGVVGPVGEALLRWPRAVAWRRTTARCASARPAATLVYMDDVGKSR